MKTLLICLALSLPALAWAVDEETARLERAALCQAMPYRCPGFVPDAAPRVVQAPQPPDFCANLAKHKAVVRRQRKEWKTPIDAEGEAALRVWDTTCRAYQQRHHLWEPDGDEKAKAWSAAAWERSERRYRSTTNCRSTWPHGPYSSRLTTTCTTD